MKKSVALIAAALAALSLSSCAVLDLTGKAITNLLPYEEKKNLFRYDTIVSDGEIYRFSDNGDEIKSKFTENNNLYLGDTAEYLIADENGVPFDDTKTETDAYYLDVEKKYIIIPDKGLVFVKGGEE